MIDRLRREHLAQLKRLAVFAVVVDAGSLTGAGKRLGLAKSAVSRYVRELEDELGAPLLLRTTRKLQLTEDGQRVFADCERLVESAVLATHRVQQAGEALRGTLHIASQQAFGQAVVLPALRSFMRAHPELDVRLSFGDQMVNLVDHAVDLTFRVGAVGETAAYIAKKVYTARYRLFASEAFVQRHGVPKTPDELEQLDWVLHGLGPQPDRWTLQRGSQTWNLTVPSRLQANDSAALVAAAQAGLGVVGVLDFEGGSDDLGLVQLVPDCSVVPEIPVFALYPQRKFVPARVRAFLDHFEQYVDSVR